MSSSRGNMGLPWGPILYIAVILVFSTSAVPPPMAPFFFLCNYHGDQDQSTLDNGEVAISVSIANNPEHYVPNKIYKVTVVSSHDFDGFLLTGVYTTAGGSRGPLASVLGTAGSGLHCMPVHNYVSDQPEHSLSFSWRAPPAGTGCINFLATATLREDVLFKDTTVMQICEEGTEVSVTARPALADVHEEGIVLRDDFDSTSALDVNIWSQIEGAQMGDGCGTILHGDSLVFCETTAIRSLVSVPLNLTTASVVQFALGAGVCQPSVYDRSIEVLYAKDTACNNWTLVDQIRSPRVSAVSVHLVHLPQEARAAEVCLQWRQVLATNANSYAGCWAMDNVVVVNKAEPPYTLYDNFDPVDPTNWIFFPGGEIKHKCQSDMQTLVFAEASNPQNYATTRDIRLEPSDFAPLISHDFDGQALQGWIIKGGRLGMDCGNPGSGASLVFDGMAKARQLCTPALDLTSAAGLRFSFKAGGTCQKDSLPLQKSKVFVYVEDDTNQTIVILTLDMHPNKGTQHLSVPIPPLGRGYEYRLCWIQKQHGGLGWDVWQADNIQLIPLLPTVPEHFIQFSMNTDCVSSAKEMRVDMEFSTDHGEHWFPLYQRCLPGQCPGQLQTISNIYNSNIEEGWTRHTVPLPLAAVAPYVRFRWRQSARAFSGGWALDNVFIGKCINGCSGHGQCTATGCKCDYGYDGTSCEDPSGMRPTLLVESLSSVSSIRSHFEIIKGASLSYSCGLVASGKAVVFNREGPRMLQTIELNTTLNRYLQFSIRLGSSSSTGECPSPTNITQSVFLHYTCTGGVLWSLLKTFSPEQVPEAKVHLVVLPEGARQSTCHFRWWQVVHSGPGRDVWAIDDVSLTHQMYNTINLDFGSRQDTNEALDVHLGELEVFCGRSDVLRFIREYEESQTRYVMTTSMHIGPSYVLQFDIIIGCSTVFTPALENPVRLEYSTDHGMTWQLVRGGCHPPAMCSEYHQPTSYDASQYSKWTRVTITLPQNTWSGATRFRWLQTKWAPKDSWAIDNLYVGQQCPQMCSGHGYCQNVVCHCDVGYTGDHCSPIAPNPSHLKTDFTILSNLDDDWRIIQGGDVAGANHGCGVILSGESLYFSKAGVRQAVTRDLNTFWADYIQFYIRVGGTNSLLCTGTTLRQENVLVQYSNDGGIIWHLLKELHVDDYREPAFVHIVLPLASKTGSTRFRFWQPKHSGEATDQWAMDEIVVGNYHGMQQLLDDFESIPHHDGPTADTAWLTVTEGMYDKYCQSPDHVLVFMNQNNDKFAMTKDLILRPGDIVQFKINVGCSGTFSFLYPVYLQYSQDSGRTWNLLEKPCPISSSCHGHFSDGSIYYTGTYGEWRLIVIPVSSELTKGKVNLRWWQSGSATSSFGIDDVYIGSPCPAMCNGHGVCVQGRCKCKTGFTGTTCRGSPSGRQGLIDHFDDMSRPGAAWGVVRGGSLARGCGKIGTGNALYFHGEGTREAITAPIDIRNIKMLEFNARIGSPGGQRGCRRPQSRNEGVLVQYSVNNGITWELLKVLDAEQFSKQVNTVTIPIPAKAKTAATVIRWWQPITKEGSERAEWAIDDVVVAVNDTSAAGFQDNFDPMLNDAWHMAMNAIPKITCSSRSNALEFSKNEGQMRYAETWDYEITPLTFLQFDIAMGCSGTFSTVYSVQLQYSVDRGRRWHPVQGTCLPPALDCSGYHQSSTFLSQSHANWTRVSVSLPAGAISPSTRFRWLQGQVALRGNVWALDNVYLGDGCSWMCSGHGYCNRGRCVCDPGFSGPYCVPATPLPMSLKTSFEEHPSGAQWSELYGGEPTNICGTLVSGKAITFYKTDLRMLVSRDLDVSMAMYIQFTFRYGCGGSTPSWPHEHSVLLQYSNNGGIRWQRLKFIHYKEEIRAKFFSVPIPSAAKTNATRFRFWQPRHDGQMKSVWSLDDLVIGGSMVTQDSVYETFDAEPHPDDWLFWPGGRIERYCDLNTRSDTIYAGTSTMLFQKTDGERSVTTRDLNVNDMSIVQFDINVGCTTGSESKHPVRLEYSEDAGKTWRLVIAACSQDSLPSCTEQTLDPTIYYVGTSPYWRRIIVPLSDLRICGLIRFRWYQGHFRAGEVVADWALDNVYVGMQCAGHCSGHGTCINGLLCECDDTYSSSRCTSAAKRPAHLLEDFDGSHPATKGTTWNIVSGGEPSNGCGVLVSGKSFHFTGSGYRVITSADLDLSVARIVQFVIRLGCSSTPPRQQAEAVLLQYSSDGGTYWHSVESFSFGSTTNKPVYVALTVPDNARTNATRFRWWQPSVNGTFKEEWAIDQIYIGGDISGHVVVQDDLSPPKAADRYRPFSPWTYWPGSVRETACASETNALHFSETGLRRELWTTDVTVTASTYIQFDLSMGCTPGDTCYEISLEYSLNMGHSWDLVQRECLPSNVDCSNYFSKSVFSSEVSYDWHRISMVLPYYTRSPATRFRWKQSGPQKSGLKTWAVTRLYIGDECNLACSGHGRCDRGACRCDAGWGGVECADPENLPSSLSDDFSSGPARTDWNSVVGGALSSKCGVLVAGTSLHFTGTCRRQLVSRDLDLRSAMFIQFHFRFGCVARPTQRDEAVLIDYSSNGGIAWHNILEIYYDQYHTASYVMADLPTGAKRNGVRIRWWQPDHAPGSNGDWALDNIVIGGRETNPVAMRDSFDGDSINQNILWLQKDNIETGSHCGKKQILKSIAGKSRENVTLVTADMSIEEGYILQFSMSVGCNASWDLELPPVHLEFSTDYGMTWRHVVQGCLPYFPECNGHAATSSAYYLSGEWHRVTIVLLDAPVSRSTRFRWHQVFWPSQHVTPSGDGPVGEERAWALDDVYIGPACTDNCHGRGQCNYPTCSCDKHYGGDNCIRVSPARTYLKDTFDGVSVDESQWSLVQGGTVAPGCTTLVEGSGLHFRGEGQRQAVTIDLDLRNARFIQYHIAIGGVSTKPGCGRPTSRNESIVLQYSNDAGIMWHTLHVLDPSEYWEAPRHDYIPLPPYARTSATRVRWFQIPAATLPGGTVPQQPRVGWTLDDVFIGGSEINPSELLEHFEEQFTEQFWEFAPGGNRRSGVCSALTGAMLWSAGVGVRSLTTSQLIIQQDYMLQFWVMVSCGAAEHNCNLHQAVWLEFNKDPTSDRWELVFPQCFVNGHEYNMECKPYQYDTGTIYTANSHPRWSRITMLLPAKVHSSHTRLRWIQTGVRSAPGPEWAVDDVYIGETCPDMCNGRGDCRLGQCFCDQGYIGESCMPVRRFLPSHMIDGFDGGPLSALWVKVSGGEIGLGCGALLPFAHGRTLYFSDCGLREAITVEMDTTKAKKIMFVIRIGSHEQGPTCNAEISGGRYGIVLLQYTKNKGIDWHSIASHEPHEFLTPRRVAYDIPQRARAVGVQFRWWQPEHRGAQHDQWAIDYVEVIMTRREQMLRTMGGRRRHNNLISYRRHII